jgi:hypothetical protein
MPIRLLLEHDHAFTPEDVKVLIEAFEETLRALELADREDQLTIAVAKLIIQFAKRILDRDHRLGSEVCHQLDLLVSEGAHVLAVDHNRADKLVFLQHRHGRSRMHQRSAALVSSFGGMITALCSSAIRKADR